MKLIQRIEGFSKLGDSILTLDESKLAKLTASVVQENPWFTSENIRIALQGITKFLEKDKLLQWTSGYDLRHENSKNVGIVMAGNIPLVGFHDFLCVLISGHVAQLKLSSKDSKLINFVVDELVKIEPRFSGQIKIQDERLENFDAVIATGSDNSARHFEYYFRKYPNIIRRNRSSCAVLTGDESTEELTDLGKDIFMYFGLGCRNVSKIFAPDTYDVTYLLDKWDTYKEVVHHHKYANNYDYQRSVLLIDQKPFFDNGYVILQQSEKLVSPISVVYYEGYKNNEELTYKLDLYRDKIQCIVGKSEHSNIQFGKSQTPEVWEYADGVDTLKFLSTLN